jgi:hypothetical protein
MYMIRSHWVPSSWPPWLYGHIALLKAFMKLCYTLLPAALYTPTRALFRLRCIQDTFAQGR